MNPQHPTASNTLAADCLITAAGFSSRMGDWKMILPYHGTTLLETSIARAKACCARIILILGYRAEELTEQYANQPGITLVVNPHPEAGLLSSIQAGLQHSEHPYIFLTHGDMPRIEAETFFSLWSKKGDKVLFPSYQNKVGHPVLIPRAVAQNMQNATGYDSPKKWLLTQAHEYIEQASPGILFDIDTPEQYQEALKKC